MKVWNVSRGDQEPISGWQNQFQWQLCNSNYATVFPPFSLMLWVSGNVLFFLTQSLYGPGRYLGACGEGFNWSGSVKFGNHDLSSIIRQIRRFTQLPIKCGLYIHSLLHPHLWCCDTVRNISLLSPVPGTALLKPLKFLSWQGWEEQLLLIMRGPFQPYLCWC